MTQTQFQQYISSQFPSSYKLHINPKTFFDAIEYEGEDGEQKTVAHWEFGERLAFMNTECRERYKKAWAAADQFVVKAESFLPTIANRGGPKAKDTYLGIERHRLQGK